MNNKHRRAIQKGIRAHWARKRQAQAKAQAKQTKAYEEAPTAELRKSPFLTLNKIIANEKAQTQIPGQPTHFTGQANKDIDHTSQVNSLRLSNDQLMKQVAQLNEQIRLMTKTLEALITLVLR